ncbi:MULTISPECIES: DNA gyrase/topoisomerase IV subunit B [Micromonospora]|uniref:DNA gyrase/topoisomerase IV subunit B n=1 Tax=Micromonospora TaxID=1873 RepID=UPI0003EEA4EF|nr:MULTISPECIES: DNA topoisomerase IV subunit B [Micromonospora]EWM64683.1 DNA gyrase, B subunit [Micromonospora sp. M42]MBC8991692.1 type IIA DNA topoisomerase subunit B [Micromonospora chalcea]MBP1782361.1 DNA gyrase subunit B [Micromonospora sp. HB375]MCK1808257.1 type IIA DNA topoisomerase subunit B [Micromonospora sp. R42106]MCK1833406.1 type IIA DNA topoisomerase subunit B [Micromonospora sp. R42003]
MGESHGERHHTAETWEYDQLTAQPETLYGADDLTHLEGLDAVRKRPGMYIGSTDSRGVGHLVNEILDNSTDEGVAGHATTVDVILHADGSVQVDDDGRGIPTDVHAKSGISGVELVLTRLHAGGKFGGSGYKTSGGLHGVGASAVNALSRRFDVTVRRGGKIHAMSFRHGVPGVFDGAGPDAPFTPGPGLQIVGAMKRGQRTGTSIRWWHDPRYFETGAALDTEAVRLKLRNTAFLVPGVAYRLRDETGEEPVEERFHFPNGLTDMVEYLAPAGDRPVSGTLLVTGEGTYRENAADANGVMQSNVQRRAEVEVAFRWGTGYERTVECFTNTIRNAHGGTHRKGFERALARTLADAARNARGLLKPKEDAPTLDDVLEGMTAVVHVRIPEPQFTSQTKDELSTAGITKVLQGLIEAHLKSWLDDRRTKAEARTVLQKIVDAARVRLTQKQQKDAARRKTALEGAAMPAKLVDCRAAGIERSELFIVEGDSALGTGRLARSSEYQALLPIRGKILNVQKANLQQVLDNAECAAIVQVLGAGSGRTFDLSSLRYGRVLIMADADVDGAHIRTLLITLFARYMRPLIEAGRLFAAMPPLHKITTKGRNPQTVYTYTQAEMEATVRKLEKAGKQIVTPIPRFKGLGEMDADELWETTMNPATRAVRRITLDDVDAAERILELLMGEKVEPRRNWLIDSADRVDRDAIDA